MEWRHFEDAFSPQLVAADLEDDTQEFNYIDAADEGQEQFLFDEDGDGAHATAEGERADIAHEDFGRVGVVPEKAERGTDHGGAKNSELTRAGDALEFEIGGELAVAGEITKPCHRGRSNDHQTNGETVEAIGEVDGICGANQNQDHEDVEGGEDEGKSPGIASQGMNQEVWPEALEEGHVHGCRVVAFRIEQKQYEANDRRDEDLKQELLTSREAEIPHLDQLGVVVIKADSTEADKAAHSDPDINIAKIRPEESGDENRNDDQQAAHGGSASLGFVGLGAVFANELADGQFTQFTDHPGPEE